MVKKSEKKTLTKLGEKGLLNPLNRDLGELFKYDDLAGITIGGTTDAFFKAFDPNIPWLERCEYGTKSASSFVRMAQASIEAFRQFSQLDKEHKVEVEPRKEEKLLEEVNKLKEEIEKLKKKSKD
jgi:hypothetical protein